MSERLTARERRLGLVLVLGMFLWPLPAAGLYNLLRWLG